MSNEKIKKEIKEKPKGIIERFQTLIAIIFIPLGIGIAGLMIDNFKVQQEYLKISLSIIKDSDLKVNPALHDWAVDVLVKYSKPKISKELAEELKNGLEFNIEMPSDSVIKHSTILVSDTSQNKKFASEGVWFTIVSTIPKSLGQEKAESIARNIAEKIHEKGKEYSIQLYETTLTNRYAITLNGEQDKSEAIKLARTVRENGIEKTSFAQINKKWIKVEDYSFE